MTESSAILVSDLDRSFGDRQALKGLSFSVPRGVVFGFLGPNGAGKTTTIRILTGQLRPGSGTVEVLGLDPTSDGIALRHRIGVMFEDGGHYERLSVSTNLTFFGRLYQAPRERTEELLRFVGLEARARDMVSSLSRGMKQRLSLARALVGKPELLFLDEPTAGLDPVAARGVRRAIRDFAERGGTVFLTTHYLEEAQQLCHTVAILDQGQLLACAPPKELCRRLEEELEEGEGQGQGQSLDLEAVFLHLAGRSLFGPVENA